MPWFTPPFYAPPPSVPAPAPIYQTYVPPQPVAPAVRQAAQPVSAPVAQPAPAPVVAPQFTLPPALAAQSLPVSLRKVIYLPRHRDSTAQSVIEIAAAQIGWRVNLDVPNAVPLPRPSGLVWMSSPAQGAPAIYDLWRLGASLGAGYTINIDAADHVITFMKAA